MPRSIFGWRGVTACTVLAAVVGAVLLSCAQIIGLSSLDRVACVGDCGTDAKVDVTPKTEGGKCVSGSGLCCSDKDCTQSPSAPHCYVQTGTCVPCLPASPSDAGSHDCPVGMTCTASGNSFGCAVGCARSSDCPTDAGTPECCDNACVYPANDPQNCGGCGKACSTSGIATPTCGDGGCNGACNIGFADCDMNKQKNGCETYVKGTDTTNCGGCGIVCSTNNIPDASCSSGVCNGACAPGYAACGRSLVGDAGDAGCAVHIAGSDPSNCGACGTVCSTAHTTGVECSPNEAGTCVVLGCEPGWVACDNQQMSGCGTFVMGSDCSNCGGCGSTCLAGDFCCNGASIAVGMTCITDAGPG